MPIRTIKVSEPKGNESSRPSAHQGQVNDLIRFVLEDPGAFIYNPDTASHLFTERSLREAHNYFSDPRRYAYSICSDFFRSRCPDLERKLFSSGMSEYPQSRFWPFWNATADITPADSHDGDAIEDLLIDLWNEPDLKQFKPSMFYQTGFLEIQDRQRFDDFWFFKCRLPVYETISIKAATLTIAFDSKTRGFYSLNAKIRFEDPEVRFKYLEFISPRTMPPEVPRLLKHHEAKQWKTLLVLDRHIGDNLSLFSTHIRFLSQVKQFDLTLDTSMSPVFAGLPSNVIERFLPAGATVHVTPVPADRMDYDLIFDPYDWVKGVFDLKPQNDSGAITIVSSIELALAGHRKVRRDILDMHLESLKRMGIASQSELRPEFVRFRLSSNERVSLRQRGRCRVLGNATPHQSAKIVCLFPFGLTEDRRYPIEQLQTVIHGLLKDPSVYVAIAGNDWDTPELVQAVRNDWHGIKQPCRHRVKLYLRESLPDLIDLMLASHVVVSMDSGPLHIARTLRINPIGLYTSKINRPKELLRFPWLVEDGTAEVLGPDGADPHVAPEKILRAIYKRIR